MTDHSTTMERTSLQTFWTDSLPVSAPAPSPFARRYELNRLLTLSLSDLGPASPVVAHGRSFVGLAVADEFRGRLDSPFNSFPSVTVNDVCAVPKAAAKEFKIMLRCSHKS
jgi:hypothetical protein